MLVFKGFNKSELNVYPFHCKYCLKYIFSSYLEKLFMAEFAILVYKMI